jgi:hypothetical protein
MPDHRRRPSLRAIAFALALAALPTTGGPAVAATPGVTVEPAEALAPEDQEITVTGTGFDPAANGAVGIYVVFGPRTEAPRYFTDAELYIAARWVHVGAADVPGQATLAADGSFSTTLAIEPRFVDGHGTEVDCLVEECVVITMAAHGVADRTQDTFTPITFAPQAASPTPRVTPRPVAATPSASPAASEAASSPVSGWALPAASAALALLAGATVVRIRRRRRTDAPR